MTAYVVDEAQIELIARALFKISSNPLMATSPALIAQLDPDGLSSLPIQYYTSPDEQAALGQPTYAPYPDNPTKMKTVWPPPTDQPNWKRMRYSAIMYYAAMHEMGLI